jgi:hypothetical protein
MAQKFTAKATVYGFAGNISAGLSFAASLSFASGDLSSDRPNGLMTNNLGEPSGTWSVDGLRKLDLTAEIQASSIANATAALEEPAPQTRVTLANCRDTSLNHARWYIVPSTWKAPYKKDDKLVLSFQIACSTDAAFDLSAPIS